MRLSGDLVGFESQTSPSFFHTAIRRVYNAQWMGLLMIPPDLKWINWRAQNRIGLFTYPHMFHIIRSVDSQLRPN